MATRPTFPVSLPQVAHDRRGVAALEFAVILPVLAMTLMAVIDLGRAIEQTLRLEAAARAGAQYAMFTPTDQAGIELAARGALAGWGDVTILPAVMSCICPGAGAAACTSTGCAVALERYVSITITRGFDSLLIADLTTLQGDMTLRIR